MLDIIFSLSLVKIYLFKYRFIFSNKSLTFLFNFLDMQFYLNLLRKPIHKHSNIKNRTFHYFKKTLKFQFSCKL